MAVRDLLRHIDRAARLRRNPIAAELLRNAGETLDDRGVVRLVRGAVSAALESIGPASESESRGAVRARRMRAILERCDLQGELHRVVAADLGLSQAQFYRDRRTAVERLGEALSRYLAAAKRPQTRAFGDDIDARWNLAAHLQNVGHFAGAKAVLERLTREPLAPAAGSRAFHALVDLLCRIGAQPQARDALLDAKRKFANAQLSGDEAIVTRAELLAAEAQIASATRQSARAIRTAERGLALVRDAGDATAARRRELSVEFNILIAFGQCELGLFERALSAIGAARALADLTADPSVRVELYFHSMRAHVALPWGMADAARENDAALALARRHGLVRHEAVALGNLCAVHFLRGDYERALEHGRNALILSEPVAAPMDYALLLLTLGRVEIAIGRGRDALATLAEAKRFAGTESGAALAEIEIAEAEACTVAGDFTAAARISSRAQHVFENSGSRKLVGPALCTQAEAYVGLGERRAAASIIHDAVDAIEEAGTAYWLAQVYNASAKITGNKRHAGYAASIRAELRS